MKTLTLGAITISKVTELAGAEMPILFGLPELTSEDLKGLARWHRSEELTEDPQTSMIRLSVHSYVLRSGGLNILVDTCNGNHKVRSVPFANQLDTRYLEALQAAGLGPEDIDLVLCTHLHADHVGWNTRLENGRWVPTFPNARHLFTREDYAFVSSPEAEDLHREAYGDSILPIVEAGLAEIVEGEHIVQHEIGDGVWLEPARGHSPGCVTIHAQRRGPRAIFSGDVFHHPVQLVRPTMPFFADHDRARATANRVRLLETHADTDAVFFPAHFTGRSAGHVKRDGSGFRYAFHEQA